MRTTIRITSVRLANRYRIDEVGGDGVVRAEISPAVFDEAFAEHLAALVADYRGLAVSRGAIADDGVVLEWERFQARGMSTRRPGPGLAPGTRVTVVSDGCACAGVVQHYEPDRHLTHHTFPVRFTETGQWQLLTARKRHRSAARRERPTAGPLTPNTGCSVVMPVAIPFTVIAWTHEGGPAATLWGLGGAALDGHRTEPVAAPWRDSLAIFRTPLALEG